MNIVEPIKDNCVCYLYCVFFSLFDAI